MRRVRTRSPRGHQRQIRQLHALHPSQSSEGLIPGEEWWIVALELPADDSRDAGIRSFLTTEPGPPIPYVSWIEIGGDDPWGPVEWSRKKLVVAESALTKAHECLGVKPEG